MTTEPALDEPNRSGRPWICELCGHFMVLLDGTSSASMCSDSGSTHRLIAYTGTEQAILIRNDRAQRHGTRDP
jgi:hypothetical protein